MNWKASEPGMQFTDKQTCFNGLRNVKMQSLTGLLRLETAAKLRSDGRWLGEESINHIFNSQPFNKNFTSEYWTLSCSLTVVLGDRDCWIFMFVFVLTCHLSPSLICTVHFFADLTIPGLIWFPSRPLLVSLFVSPVVSLLFLSPLFLFSKKSPPFPWGLICPLHPPSLTSPPPRLFCCLHMSDVLHVYLSQTKMSAARTTAAASTSASTQWALTFVSVAMALYCMRTNMTVRKVGFTYIHISTHTGIRTSDRTCTRCHIRTSMCSFTRTAIVHHTALTLFIHIRVHLTADWPFPSEESFLCSHTFPHLEAVSRAADLRWRWETWLWL